MKINGKPVVDATKNFKISISEQDATEGKAKSPSDCAAARAILRVVPSARGARVHLACTYIEAKEVWVRYRTPPNLKTEIVSFDRGGKAKYASGDYTLYAPPKHEKLNARPGRGVGRRKPKPAKIARKVHQIEGVRARGANR